MIILVLSIFLFLISVVGYGKIFIKINNLNDINLSFGETGLLGLFFITFLGISLHFFFPLNQILNTFIFLIGFSFFLYEISTSKIKINFKYYKLFFFIFFASLTMILGHKPNEDFGYYHLPYIVNMNSEKIIFGLSNLQLNQGWNSSWLLIKSLFNIKIVGVKGIFVSNIIFYLLISFVFLSYFYFNKIRSGSIFFFSLFFYIFLNLKFARLNSYGIDIPSNFLVIYAFILFLFCYHNRNSDKKFFRYLEILILISIFSISFRILNLLILILPIILIFRFKVSILKLFKSRVLIFSVLFFIIWQIQQIIYTGCFLIPNELTCFKNFSWFDKDIIANFVNDTSNVNKSFQTYSGVLSREEYLSNFNWIGNWYERNHIELYEHILTFLIPVFSFIIINKNNFKFNLYFFKKENNFYILIVVFLSLVIWFLKAPVIRFATLYLQTFFLIIILYFIKHKSKKLISKKLILLFVLLSLFGNISKNILRIYNNETKNIFPIIPEIDYKTTNLEDLKLNIPKKNNFIDKSELCWDVPFLCRIGSFDDINIKMNNNYLFILKN